MDNDPYRWSSLYVMPYIKIRLMSPDIDNEIFIQLERGYLMLKNEL